MLVLHAGQALGIQIHQIQTLKKKLRDHLQVNHLQGRVHHLSQGIKLKVRKYHVGNTANHQMTLASTVMMTMKAAGMRENTISDTVLIVELLIKF